MAKKRKKHNATSRYIKVARSCLKGLAVAWTDETKNCVMVDIKRKSEVRVTEVLAKAFSEVPHHWSIFIAVMGKQPNGDVYMKSEQIKTNQPYYQNDLADYLNERHQALISGMNRNALCGVGWAAAPNGHDWSEEEAFSLFESVNGELGG
jgi:hypothetical protein